MTRRSGPVTTSAPIACSARSLAAAARLAVGSMVRTSPPFCGQNGFDGHGVAPSVAPVPLVSLTLRPTRASSGTFNGNPITPRSGSVFLSGTGAVEPAMRNGVNPHRAAAFSECRPVFGPARGAPDRTPRTTTGRRESRRHGPPTPPSDCRRHRHEPRPNSTLSPNQTAEKCEHARIAQRDHERRRRNPVGVRRDRRATCRAARRAGMQNAPRPPSCRRCRRGADHRRELAGMGQQMASAPAAAVTAKKQKSHRPNRRATGLREGQQPDRVEAEMGAGRRGSARR